MKSTLSLLLILAAPFLHAANVDVYFGTGGGDAKGIYRASFDPGSGKLFPAALAAEVDKPGFLAFHPDRTKLYAVARMEAGPAVVAYTVGKEGSLTLLNSEVIPGGGAAHISVHPSGNFLLTAQYGAGSVALFPLDKGGRVLPCKQSFQHEAGPASSRSDKSHRIRIGSAFRLTGALPLCRISDLIRLSSTNCNPTRRQLSKSTRSTRSPVVAHAT